MLILLSNLSTLNLRMLDPGKSSVELYWEGVEKGSQGFESCWWMSSGTTTNPKKKYSFDWIPLNVPVHWKGTRSSSPSPAPRTEGELLLQMRTSGGSNGNEQTQPETLVKPHSYLWKLQPEEWGKYFVKNLASKLFLHFFFRTHLSYAIHLQYQ